MRRSLHGTLLILFMGRSASAFTVGVSRSNAVHGIGRFNTPPSHGLTSTIVRASGDDYHDFSRMRAMNQTFATVRNGKTRTSFVNQTTAVLDVDAGSSSAPPENASRSSFSGPRIKNGLVTTSCSSRSTESFLPSSSSSLARAFGIRNPLDQMAVTANSTLQSLFASYYDAPVNVDVIYCFCEDGSSTWDRKVELRVLGEVFCTATSRVVVHEPCCQVLLQEGQVGLAQLFQYKNAMPTFSLLGAGYKTVAAPSRPHDRGGDNIDGDIPSLVKTKSLWREYRLESKYLTCWIREEFHPRCWDLQ